MSDSRRLQTAILAYFYFFSGQRPFCRNLGLSDVFCRNSVLKIPIFVLYGGFEFFRPC